MKKVVKPWIHNIAVRFVDNEEIMHGHPSICRGLLHVYHDPACDASDDERIPLLWFQLCRRNGDLYLKVHIADEPNHPDYDFSEFASNQEAINTIKYIINKDLIKKWLFYTPVRHEANLVHLSKL